MFSYKKHHIGLVSMCMFDSPMRHKPDHFFFLTSHHFKDYSGSRSNIHLKLTNHYQCIFTDVYCNFF